MIDGFMIGLVCGIAATLFVIGVVAAVRAELRLQRTAGAAVRQWRQDNERERTRRFIRACSGSVH